MHITKINCDEKDEFHTSFTKSTALASALKTVLAISLKEGVTTQGKSASHICAIPQKD